MNAMKTNTSLDCKTCRSLLPDLLLDPEFAGTHAEARLHMAECADCRAEYEELRATFALLDEWTAPEPSAYFDTRLHARLREEMEARPEGLWERMRSFVLYSTGRQFRPLMAGALSCALLLGGGGTFAGIYLTNRPVAASATVDDLRILDNNAQAEQQLSQLLDDGSADTSDPPTT